MDAETCRNALITGEGFLDLLIFGFWKEIMRVNSKRVETYIEIK